MKIALLALVALLLLPTAAQAGTVRGKLPAKGKPMTVRVVRADTAQLVLAKRIAKPRYKLSLKAGPYLVLGSAGKKTSRSRMVRVRKRGSKVIAMKAASPALATVAVTPFEIDGMPIDTALITEMFAVDCSNGGKVRFVEVRDRAAIEREIKLQRGPGFDPATRVKPNFTKPDTFITGSGEISGGVVTIDVKMTGRVTGSSSVSVPVSELFDAIATLGSDLMGQICDPAEEEPAPPAPATVPTSYTGSLSGQAVTVSPAGTITETWSTSGVVFGRTPGTYDSSPGYEITAGTVHVTVSGTIGACTVSGTSSDSLATDDDTDSTLDFAPDTSYYGMAYSSHEVDVAYSCPDGEGPGIHVFMSEVFRSNPMVVRRMPAAGGTVAGSVSMSKDGRQYSFNWSLTPR